MGPCNSNAAQHRPATCAHMHAVLYAHSIPMQPGPATCAHMHAVLYAHSIPMQPMPDLPHTHTCMQCCMPIQFQCSPCQTCHMCTHACSVVCPFNSNAAQHRPATHTHACSVSHSIPMQPSTDLPHTHMHAVLYAHSIPMQPSTDLPHTHDSHSIPMQPSTDPPHHTGSSCDHLLAACRNHTHLKLLLHDAPFFSVGGTAGLGIKVSVGITATSISQNNNNFITACFITRHFSTSTML